MIAQIKSYLKFLFSSSNQHGIHSPFVYDLATKCFCVSSKNIDNQSAKIKSFRDSLLKNTQTIEVTDFGAGSKVFKSNKREVAAIAKNAGISQKRAILLIKLVQYYKPKNILEIGTSLGIGTACLSLGNPDAKITTIEGCPETAKVANEYFNKFNFNNIKIEIGDFNETLPKAINNRKYDLIYFDGNHQKEATINYFKQCLHAIHNETIFIFDDIHWSKGMEEAWKHIKNHKKITVSIDTFQWGIVFFRKEQVKEHFIIRI